MKLFDGINNLFTRNKTTTRSFKPKKSPSAWSAIPQTPPMHPGSTNCSIRSPKKATTASLQKRNNGSGSIATRNNTLTILLTSD